MAITLDNLKSMLQRPNTRVFTDEDNTLLYPFMHSGQILNVEAQLIEDGDYLRLRIPYFLSAPEFQDRAVLLTKLMELNYNLKMLKFGYDPQDGEVTVTIEIPLEDNALTERQVQRCMYMLTSVAVQERDRLQNWIRTGIYPGSEDPGFIAALGRLLPPEQTERESQNSGLNLFADDLPDVLGLLDDGDNPHGHDAELE